jgi:hypothetical protein
MPSILTQNYHAHLATEFKSRLAWSETIDALAANDSISSEIYGTLTSSANTVALYLFVGRPSPWTVDVDPPTPEESPQVTGFDYWRNMLAAKRVSAANTCHVVPRVNWANATVYTQYDDTVDLTGEQFYALVLDGGTTYQVYKCLWNANGAESTEQPTGTDVTPQTYADGYVWQYLYSFPSLNEKFLSESWMPVYANASVQAQAALVPLELPTEVPLLIEGAGSSYNSYSNVTCTLDGDGTGATVANAGVTVQGGSIASIALLTGGESYTNVASINVYQLGASAATVRAIIPPYPGHGYDPIHELQAKHLMCVVQFANDEAGKLTVDNNFRQVGLLANPLLANGSLATDTTYKQTWDVTLQAGGSVYNPDDLVINTTKDPSPSGVVVDVLDAGAGKQLVRFTNVNPRGLAEPFSYGDVLKVGGLYPSTVSDDTVSGPELLPYSGHVLFVNQRIPVTRGSGETQDLKIVLPFG